MSKSWVRRNDRTEWDRNRCDNFFFPGVEFLSESFNVLFDQSLRLPSIEILRITGGDRLVLQQMMRMTPNVKTLLIVDLHSYWFASEAIVNFEDLATYVPKLEHFGWQRFFHPNRYSMHKLDEVITGLPANLCKKLTEKFRNKDSLSATQLSAYQRKRIHPSIIDLKGSVSFFQRCWSTRN